MERIPLAPAITLQFNEVLAAILTRIFLVRKYLFVFDNEAMRWLLSRQLDRKM